MEYLNYAILFCLVLIILNSLRAHRLNSKRVEIDHEARAVDLRRASDALTRKLRDNASYAQSLRSAADRIDDINAVAVGSVLTEVDLGEKFTFGDAIEESRVA